MTEKSEKPIGGFVRNRHLLILTIVTPLRGASTSRSGISVVNIELQDWVTAADNENIFSKVRDRLDDAAAELPAGTWPAQPSGVAPRRPLAPVAWHRAGQFLWRAGRRDPD